MRYRQQQPTFIPPMLLTSGALPDGDAWTFEVKWDGCRAQRRYDQRSVTFPNWRGSPARSVTVGSPSTPNWSV